MNKHKDSKAVIDRISRAAGHLQSIKKMIEEERDCSDILVQISAVRSAVNNIGRIFLKDHINHCLEDAIKNGNKKVIDDLNSVIEKFLK